MKKVKCRYCGKSRVPMKLYIIADDMENPRPYHKKCMDKMMMEVIMEMGERKGKGRHHCRPFFVIALAV